MYPLSCIKISRVKSRWPDYKLFHSVEWNSKTCVKLRILLTTWWWKEDYQEKKESGVEEKSIKFKILLCWWICGGIWYVDRLIGGGKCQEKLTALLSLWDPGRKPLNGEALHWHGAVLARKEGKTEWMCRERDYLIAQNFNELSSSASAHKLSFICLMITEVSLIKSPSVRLKCHKLPPPTLAGGEVTPQLWM